VPAAPILFEVSTPFWPLNVPNVPARETNEFAACVVLCPMAFIEPMAGVDLAKEAAPPVKPLAVVIDQYSVELIEESVVPSTLPAEPELNACTVAELVLLVEGVKAKGR